MTFCSKKPYMHARTEVHVPLHITHNTSIVHFDRKSHFLRVIGACMSSCFEFRATAAQVSITWYQHRYKTGM